MKQATVTQIEKIWLSNKEAQVYLGVGMDFLKNLRSSGRISGSLRGYTSNKADELGQTSRFC